MNFFLVQQTAKFNNEFYQLIALVIGAVVTISTLAFPVILNQREESIKSLKSKVSDLESKNQELKALKLKLTRIEAICETALGASGFTENSANYYIKVVTDIQAIVELSEAKQAYQKEQRPNSRKIIRRN
ncbi:MAG: hypothetical protein F6K22_31330 [Okeania sp. SIO2F4]|uniref:hypothetical protein n=1 Tax=Okeania sp. SIO2F4 TaxID=2607790 RepID=UPI00142BC96D|nr:hypothetical protein [Okeania sp. SIO2F4]NES06912.1 hypothetical protein [Okeania sp. SIO2F4]